MKLEREASILQAGGRFVVLAALAMGGILRASEAVDFEREIRPLLREHCVGCHGPLKQKGGLRLDAGSLVLKGGEHGSALVRGQSGSSLLVERITSTDEEKRMPREGGPLSAEKIEKIRRWIDAGAPHPENEKIAQSPADHWAFRPVARPAVPRVKDASWVRTPIDAFVLAGLEAQNRPAPPLAPAPVLLRRLHLDLIGFPPTLAEQDRLAAQAGEGALDAVIDDLLARPAHGERWARHWLDVVRYADSNGYERDAAKPYVWRYRDYVIDAINRDKPFDRFIVEQIAGDQLPDRDTASVIATGFLRLGHWDDEPADPAADRYDQLDDIVSTAGQAFLGLTIGCARCHDHKFEPLSQRDYYGLVAVFLPLERPRSGRTEHTVNIDGTEVYAWTTKPGAAPESHVLVRGSPARPGDPAPPSVPAILAPGRERLESASNETPIRLALARWVAGPGNPLTARVIVNRVWQQHFGSGLVTTANDFGLMGAPPSDAALLDWLADWFTHEGGWSLKRLHRLILGSNAWRSAVVPGSPFRSRRLEVEAIRDSALAASGRLNRRSFGPAMKPPVPEAALEANTDKAKIWQPSSEDEASRRTIYAFVKRGLVVPMLEALDLADTVGSCPQRQVTTVAPQALCLLNGEFVNQQARHFAERLRREAGADSAAQIRLAWRLALCREPSAAEFAAMQDFLKVEPLTQLCRVLFNLNEFVYPE